MYFGLFIPSQAVGASLVYFDVYNAGPHLYDVHSCMPVVDGSTAVVGAVAINLYLTRTSAIGTGGTAATMNGTSLTAATFSGLNNSQALDGTLTARLTPTGGATAGAVLSWRSVFGEETNAGAYTPNDLILPNSPPIVVGPSSGIRVVQSSVASAGNVGFQLILRQTR